MKDPSTTTEDNLEKLLQTEHLHYICQIYLMANDNGGILKYKMQEIMSMLHYILSNISNPGHRVNRTGENPMQQVCCSFIWPEVPNQVTNCIRNNIIRSEFLFVGKAKAN
jgi:hypothetical protein